MRTWSVAQQVALNAVNLHGGLDELLLSSLLWISFPWLQRVCMPSVRLLLHRQRQLPTGKHTNVEAHGPHLGYRSVLARPERKQPQLKK